MDGCSPSEIAAILKRFRKFNSSGTSEVFSPPQNTPPDVPVNGLHQPTPQIAGPTVIHNHKAQQVKKPVPTKKPKPPSEDQIGEDILAVEIHPEILERLKPFQVPHVKNMQYALETNTIALDSSDTGTGKTYSACALAKNMGLDLIVICPKPVITPWYETADMMDVNVLMVVNYETLRNGKYYYSFADFKEEERDECPYIELVREVIRDEMTNEPVLTANGTEKTKVVDILWHFPDNCLVVFDEAHKGKNGLCAPIPTINSRVMMTTKRFFKADRRIYGLFLSATITDRLTNFDVISFLLGMYAPYNKKAYRKFIRSFSLDPQGQLEAIHAKIFPRLGSRMNIRDIKKATGNTVFRRNDVKAKAYEIDAGVAAEIEEEHVKIRQAMNMLRNKIENDGPHPLVVILRARQRIELLKVQIFVDLVNWYVTSPELKTVVIFANFNETIDLIAEKVVDSGILELSEIDFIRGGQTGTERADIIEAFQADELRLLICNMQAGGVGISLHDLHGDYQRVSLLSPTWAAIDMKQAIGRIDRAGAQTDCIQRIVYAKSSNPFGDDSMPGIEEMMCAALNAKLRNIALLNDGDLQNYDDFTAANMHE